MSEFAITDAIQKRKLLRRLKLSMWFITIVIIAHSLPARFPELYPLTRWEMFSQASSGPKILREGVYVLLRKTHQL